MSSPEQFKGFTPGEVLLHRETAPDRSAEQSAIRSELTQINTKGAQEMLQRFSDAQLENIDAMFNRIGINWTNFTVFEDAHVEPLMEKLALWMKEVDPPKKKQLEREIYALF